MDVIWQNHNMNAEVESNGKFNRNYKKYIFWAKMWTYFSIENHQVLSKMLQLLITVVINLELDEWFILAIYLID